MANTTNLSLGKLAGTENLKNFPTVQSDNMDKIDQAVGAGFGSTRNVGGVTDALADAIAILANGNTHAAITSGQYVYVKNHASLTEGLYVATTNIAANATLSGSNLSADSSGGLNAALAGAKSYTDGLIGTVPSGNTVEGQITSLSNHIENKIRHTRKTDFSLSDLQSAVVDQCLEKYGLHVGDQKTINGRTYVIAGLNVMKGSHAYTCTSNHVGLIVIPHTTCKWNASGNTYTGADNRGAGYKNCDLQYYLANTVKGWCDTDLGSGHLYQHKKLFGNAINQTRYNRFGTNSGCTSGWEWVDAYISALTEAQVFGGDHWSSSGYDTGEANTLLPVFAEFKHTDIFGNEYPWLRNVSSASQACNAADNGIAGGEAGVGNAFSVAGLILYH